MLKTMRNALYSSAPDGVKYFLYDDLPIVWSDLQDSRARDKTRLANGNPLWLPRLTENVLHLTAWSKMRVGLAKVPMAERTYSEMKLNGGPQAQKTQEYLSHTGQIFDHILSHKPYRAVTDVRFQEIKTHLDWFYSWFAAVQRRTETESLTKRAKNRFFLASQTWANLRCMVSGWTNGETQGIILWVSDSLSRF